MSGAGGHQTLALGAASRCRGSSWPRRSPSSASGRRPEASARRTGTRPPSAAAGSRARSGSRARGCSTARSAPRRASAARNITANTPNTAPAADRRGAASDARHLLGHLGLGELDLLANEGRDPLGDLGHGGGEVLRLSVPSGQDASGQWPATSRRRTRRRPRSRAARPARSRPNRSGCGPLEESDGVAQAARRRGLRPQRRAVIGPESPARATAVGRRLGGLRTQARVPAGRLVLGGPSARDVRLGGAGLVGARPEPASRLWSLRLLGHSGGSSPNTRVQIRLATRVAASWRARRGRRAGPTTAAA